MKKICPSENGKLGSLATTVVKSNTLVPATILFDFVYT